MDIRLKYVGTDMRGPNGWHTSQMPHSPYIPHSSHSPHSSHTSYSSHARQEQRSTHARRTSTMESAQAGFSLVEVSVVMAIVLLLAIIAIPTVSAYVIESKVPKVGEELARFILHTKVNASNGSSAPYDGIATSNLANMLRDSTIFSITGDASAPTLRHGLGSDGQVEVAEADAGAAFTITLSNVNHAACPAIASVMQRVSRQITLASGGAAAAVVKDDTTRYSALDTESRCTQGDVNTFVFTVS